MLDLMGRTYTSKEYFLLVDEIRRRVPEIGLSTDIICGFCTESEDDFQHTFRAVEEIGYHLAFIFRYSERKQTIAARKYPDDVPEPDKVDRVNRLIDLQRRISLRKNQEMVGRTVEVLVEGDAKKSANQWMGKSDGNITVIWEKGTLSTGPGDLVNINVTRASVTALFGQDVRSH